MVQGCTEDRRAEVGNELILTSELGADALGQ